MNVLSISFERNAFKAGDPARRRFALYGTVFSELHVIAYARKAHGLSDTQVAENVWLYPTNSLHPLFYVLDAVRIARTLRRKGIRPDIVSGQDLGETGIAAWRIARMFKVPLHLQDHADVFDPEFRKEGFGNWMRYVLAPFLLGSADCVRTVLETGQKRILDRFPRLRGKVSVLPVYVDTDTRTAPAFSLHERYPDFSKLVLMASRLVPQKDIPTALHAMKIVVQEDPSVGLVLVGEGKEGARIRALVKELGLQKNVVQVPWEKDLVPYYKGADLFLLTSRYESYCRTLVEAAASGLPFVSTDVGVARMLMEGGAAGWVAARRDPEEIASLIQGALKEPRQGAAADALNAVRLLVGVSEEEYARRYRDSLTPCMPARV